MRRGQAHFQVGRKPAIQKGLWTWGSGLRAHGMGELGSRARWCWGLSAQGVGDRAPEGGLDPRVLAAQGQPVQPKVN